MTIFVIHRDREFWLVNFARSPSAGYAPAVVEVLKYPEEEVLLTLPDLFQEALAGFETRPYTTENDIGVFKRGMQDERARIMNESKGFSVTKIPRKNEVSFRNLKNDALSERGAYPLEKTDVVRVFQLLGIPTNSVI